jgi:hypothetical protein
MNYEEINKDDKNAKILIVGLYKNHFFLDE